MDIPETGTRAILTQTDAAPQRGQAEALQPHLIAELSRPTPARGPQPLPQFLAAVTHACAGDPARLAAVLRGLRRYQELPLTRPRRTRPVAARAGGVSLRDHGGTGPLVVVIPSLINPPTVLDLAPGNSLLDGLAARGLKVLTVDWGPTEPLGLAGLVEQRLVPLIAGLAAPVALIGYCLGGTLSVAVAALLAHRVTRLALLATPWHFGGYGGARAGLATWWQDAAPLAQALGALPMALLQPAFWSLDPAGLAAKYARFADLPDGPRIDAFAALEDWSNGGQPLSLAVARELATDLFEADRPGRGVWEVAGHGIDPALLDIPILDIIAARDRIVPPSAALTTAGPGTPLCLQSGHVGMIVGGAAPALLWDPLAAWLRA